MPDDEATFTRQLTTRIAKGDSDAISQFYEEFFDIMFREAKLASHRGEEFCLDVVQESMLRIIRKMRPMATFAQLRSWTRRLVRSVAYDQLRSEFRRKRREIHSFQWNAAGATAETLDDLEAVQEQLRWLTAQIRKLDASDSRLLFARYRSGLTLHEIAYKYGLSLGAVDGRIRRLVARLRQRYQEASYDEGE